MQSEKELRERINKLAELAAGVRQKNLSRRVSKTLLGVIAVIALLLPFIGLLIEGRSNINPDNITREYFLVFIPKFWVPSWYFSCSICFFEEEILKSQCGKEVLLDMLLLFY